jgi:hypothetical protein
VSEGIDAFVAAAPPLQRHVLRALIALERRPRGARLLARVPVLEHAAAATLALGRWDDPRLAASLGWDAEAVAARGLALRRAEGRP